MADEKFDEKSREKEEEKSPQEKSWDEKWRRDPISAVIWAILLIWAGVALLIDNMRILDQWQTSIAAATGLTFIADMPVWSVILTGAGIIVLVEVVIRLLIPEYRRSVGGTLIFGFILIGVGLGNEIGWSLVLPLIFIGLGLSIILRGIVGRR